MIRAIVLASLVLGATAQAATGLATCACLGEALWATFAPSGGYTLEKPCSWEWADSAGNCQVPSGLASNFTDYPGDFGETCKVWPDPGHSACYDLTTVPPEAKAISDQADWCLELWCYVDPCNCDASDATKSDYFPGTLFYSYATCGAKNMYTAVESATNTVGNAECATADESSSDDAQSLKMGLGLMFVGMGALM
jgi:hypothetical protein